MPYIIESAGPAGTSRVINPRTGGILRFTTRAQARAYAEKIKPEMPSKNLPLRVREAAA